MVNLIKVALKIYFLHKFWDYLFFFAEESFCLYLSIAEPLALRFCSLGGERNQIYGVRHREKSLRASLKPAMISTKLIEVESL